MLFIVKKIWCSRVIYCIWVMKFLLLSVLCSWGFLILDILLPLICIDQRIPLISSHMMSGQVYTNLSAYQNFHGTLPVVVASGLIKSWIDCDVIHTEIDVTWVLYSQQIKALKRWCSWHHYLSLTWRCTYLLFRFQVLISLFTVKGSNYWWNYD